MQFCKINSEKSFSLVVCLLQASNFNITPEDDAFDKLVSESKASERPLSPSKPKSKKVNTARPNLNVFIFLKSFL